MPAAIYVNGGPDEGFGSRHGAGEIIAVYKENRGNAARHRQTN